MANNYQQFELSVFLYLYTFLANMLLKIKISMPITIIMSVFLTNFYSRYISDLYYYTESTGIKNVMQILLYLGFIKNLCTILYRMISPIFEQFKIDTKTSDDCEDITYENDDVKDVDYENDADSDENISTDDEKNTNNQEELVDINKQTLYDLDNINKSIVVNRQDIDNIRTKLQDIKDRLEKRTFDAAKLYEERVKQINIKYPSMSSYITYSDEKNDFYAEFCDEMLLFKEEYTEQLDFVYMRFLEWYRMNIVGKCKITIRDLTKYFRNEKNLRIDNGVIYGAKFNSNYGHIENDSDDEFKKGKIIGLSVDKISDMSLDDKESLIIFEKTALVDDSVNSKQYYKDSSPTYQQHTDKLEIKNPDGYDVRKMHVRTERVPICESQFCCSDEINTSVKDQLISHSDNSDESDSDTSDELKNYTSDNNKLFTHIELDCNEDDIYEKASKILFYDSDKSSDD